MTETSFFWDGEITGDAILAKYSADVYATLWQKMFTRGDSEGILNGVDNELAVSGVSVSVSIATGKALVDGSFYETDTPVSISIPTPVSDPRIDRIVLQKDWVLKTIRIARVGGTENASPTAPALTQTALTLWEIPLAQVLVTTAGVITVTNESQICQTRLAPAIGMQEIATLVGDGVSSSMNFSSIPATFKHLLLTGNFSITSPTFTGADLYLNNDTTTANYNRYQLLRFNGSVVSTGNVGTGPLVTLGGVGADRGEIENVAMPRIYFANYKNTIFYKTAILTENLIQNETINDFRVGLESGIWKNTEAIHTINLVSGAPISDETILTLYGLT